MTNEVLDRANEAVFYFQYPTKQAVDYVVRNCQVDMKSAKQALIKVMTGYKTKS
jgi:hypothetical protein